MTDTLDLIIIDHNAGSLTTNSAAILEAVKVKLAGYSAENYSEANIQDAKSDKAALNQSAKALSQARIQLERAHMASIEEGIGIIKQAEAEIKTASAKIDEVVKQVEAREKAEKETALREYFAGLGTELVTFDQLFAPEWVNKSTSLKSAKAAILAKVESIKGDLETVQAFGDEAVTAFFLKSLSLPAAMKMAADLKAGRERAAKLSATTAPSVRTAGTSPEPEGTPIVATVAPPIMTRAERPADVSPPMPASPEISLSFPHPVMPELTEPEKLTRAFRVVATEFALEALVDWMDEAGIEWEKVEV